MRRLLVPLSLLLLCALPGAARALTISAEPGPDCFSTNPDKCIGGVYTLDVASAGSGTWVATFTMDLGPGLEIPATTIEQIEFKVAGEYENISIEMAPGGDANWSPVDGPLGASGCSGNNGGFICLDATNPVAVSPTIFTWQVQFDADTLLDESSWHIGARFASPTHSRGWILSASAPIPEPSSYLMFALGAGIVGFALRRSIA